MSGFRIKLTNVKIKDGKVEKTDNPKMSVSQKIAKKKSKRVRVAKPGATK